MLCNELPHDLKTERPVQERTVIIPFLETFTGEKQETKVDETILLKEREDIFRLLVDNLEELGSKPEDKLTFDIPSCIETKKYE